MSARSMQRQIAALCLAAAGFGAVAASLSPDLIAAMRAHPGAAQRVIVQTAARPNSSDTVLPARLGGRVTRVFAGFPGYAAQLPAASVYQVARRGNVRRLSLDRPVAATARKLPKGGVCGPWDHAARSVGADLAWIAGAAGDGIGVAIIDTGVAPSPDISLAGFVDLVNGRAVPYDDNGHGTHVAGIVAGTGACSGGLAGPFPGVAPGVRLVAVKALDGAASGYASSVIAALDWCVANRAAYNLRVVNLSLGQGIAESYKDDPLCQACERAVSAGLVVVAAAGNAGDGYGGILSPGNDPAVLTVGAAKTMGTPVRSDDCLAGYSSRGPTYIDNLAKPDVLAPGNKIASVRAPGSYLDTRCPGNRVLPYAYGGPDDQARYFVLSGSSMAAPIVSGICALVLSVRPDLGPNAVKAAVMLSAQRIGGYDAVRGVTTGEYDWMAQGSGYVNAIGAVRAAGMLQTGSDLADAEEPPVGWGSDEIQGECVLWGDCVLWGNSVLSARMPWALRTVRWDNSVLWGDGSPWTAAVALGPNAVGATSVLWGNSPSRRANALSVLTDGE